MLAVIVSAAVAQLPAGTSHAQQLATVVLLIVVTTMATGCFSFPTSTASSNDARAPSSPMRSPWRPRRRALPTCWAA
jgi:hypothetical protein